MTLTLRHASSRSAGATRLLSLLMLCILALGAAACQPSIELLAAPATPYPLATIEPAAGGLEIIGVDFDPPLEHAQIGSGGGVTLLVAVENHDDQPVNNIKVTARLLDPVGLAGQSELLNETVTVRSLAAGELRVVRFTQVTDLPVRDRYQLAVSLEQKPAVATNRAYDIMVKTGE